VSEQAETRRLGRRLAVKAASWEQRLAELSGGNQQKVVIAKWLATRPKVIVLDEPTKGIDVGARANIYEIIHSLAARGKGVLVVSSEAEELLSLCHRILVMRNGQIVDEFDPEHADTDDLIRTALSHED
jgi:ABC-type sugar transport system ATPase subunit